MTAFDDALALVLKQEGGRVDDPHDPGGRTNQGITQRVYDTWRASQGLSRRDVYVISQDEVTAIYENNFAQAIRFTDLPIGVSYCVFDGAVNSGPVQAIKWLQQALGVTVDGHIGIMTISAAARFGATPLINAMCDERLGFLRHLSTWLHFENGWTRRVAFVRLNATMLAGKAKLLS